jgi:hypothetical protein
MQDLGYDAFRSKDGDQILLAEIIPIHQRAKDFDRRSIRNGLMLFFAGSPAYVESKVFPEYHLFAAPFGITEVTTIICRNVPNS